MISRATLVSSRCFGAVSSVRGAKTLVIGEHDNTNLLSSTLAAVMAATKLGKEVDLLIAGNGIDKTVGAQAATVAGVTKVIALDSSKLSKYVAEDLTKAIVSSGVLKNYTHVLHGSSNVGKNFFPRLAALSDASPATDVMEIVSEDTVKRPMYAGNAIATVKMSDPIKFLLIRPTAFEKAATTGGSAKVEVVALSDDQISCGMTTWMAENTSKSERPDLTAARVVVSGGRGLKSGENFAMLEKLADKLGGAVGASRAAVDAGYAPNDYQVGQTGKVVAPDLYIAVSTGQYKYRISGAIQHLSGMKDSKVIVAINKDKEAPIFQVADYGYVGDLFKIIPELNEKL